MEEAKPKGDEVVVAHPREEPLEIIQKVDVQHLLDVIERRNEFIEKALPMAIAVTKPHEWTMYGKQPWPGVTACEKIMERFGVQAINNVWNKELGEDDKGKYYLYIWEADFILPGFHTYHAVGTTTSRDQFFAIRDGELRPLHEVSEDNILKAAQSNCIVRGTTGLLGFRKITTEELAKAGLDVKNIGKVTFAGYSEKDKKAADENREALIADWVLLVNYCQMKDLDPIEAMHKKFLGKKKAGDDGLDYCSLERVKKFKRAEVLGWLKRATAEAKQSDWFDKKDFEEFKEVRKQTAL